MNMVEFVFDKIICLPMYLTDKSRFKIIRIAGTLSMFIWFILVFPFLFIIPFLILIETLIEVGKLKP